MNRKKIKEKLINLLGGLTMEQSTRSAIAYLNFVSWMRVKRIREYLDMMNGARAEDWCKMAYNYVKRIEKELEDKIGEKEEA